MSKNEKQGKNGRKTQLERVMHEGARGHEAEPKNSHFLCPKTKRSKTREKGATGESHARAYKRSQEAVEPNNSHFLCPKTKRSKTREKGATGESHAPTCKRTRGRAQSLHFLYSTTERNYNQRIQGLYTQHYEEICTHIFFLVPYKCKR